MDIVGGYYQPHWHVAVEIGFDKAIVTHFKHSESFKQNVYALVQDGWYSPATGGNLTYGLQGGLSFKKMDVFLKAGRVITEDFTTTPQVPFYAQLGVDYRFLTNWHK